jgi:hypothetical protein
LKSLLSGIKRFMKIERTAQFIDNQRIFNPFTK